jgi:hypothetical protein
MGPEWVAIIALVALFVVGTVLPINMGALAYVAAWLVGMYSRGLVAALAVSSTIVDVSPFSTNGALMLANKPDTIEESTSYKQILGYATIVTLVGPLLVWAALVLPGW